MITETVDTAQKIIGTVDVAQKLNLNGSYSAESLIFPDDIVIYDQI